MHDNFARPHETLTKAANGSLTTPAMADQVWTLVEIAALPDEGRRVARAVGNATARHCRGRSSVARGSAFSAG